MTAALAILNPAAQVALVSCEQRIERGLKTFIDVGQALAEIRDSRLYKGTHDTFEDYCRERWGFSRQRAQQFTAAAELATTMVDTGLPTPTNERQTRELAKVPEAERAEVWREAVERTEGKPTAAAVREVAAERTQTPEPVESLLAASAGPGQAPAPATAAPGPSQEPDRHLSVVPDPPAGSPATWTAEQHEANRLEVQRKQAIAAAERFAKALVLEVRGMVTAIIDGIDYGAPGILVSLTDIDECRAALDRLEARVMA